MSSVHPNSAWKLGLAIGALVALPVAGCTNEPAATHQGSWIEILELEESPDALDVEHLDAFVSVEESADRLVFTFSGPSPLRVGHVVGGSGPDRVGYLRRILAINDLPDGRVEAMTEQAFLQDYYPTLHFLFHYDPVRVDEATVAEIGVATEALGGGCEDTTPCDISGGRSWGSSTAGCSAEYGASLYAGPFVETDFSATFEFDHGISIVPPRFRPDAYFDLEGDVRAGVRLRGTAAAQLTCNADFAALIGGGEAPKVRLAYLQIGPIPVTISATPVLEGELSVTADVGEFHAEAGAHATASAQVGVIDGEFTLEHEFTFDPFAQVETARAGALSAHTSLTAGAEIEVQVGWDFSISRAEIDLGAVATARLTGTLGADLTADVAGCSWDIDLPWSADVVFGVGVDATASLDIPWAPDVSIDWTRRHTWDSINLASGSLGSLSGSLPWCGMTPDMCLDGGSVCHDDLLDNGVCEGMMGFQSCGGMGSPYYQRCRCTTGGWVDCGSCMPG